MPTDDQPSRSCQVQQYALQLFLSRGMGTEQRRQKLLFDHFAEPITRDIFVIAKVGVF